MGGPERKEGLQAADPARVSNAGLAPLAAGLTGAVARMHASAGNAAVARLLQRDPDSSSSGGGVGTAPAPPVEGSSQSSAGGVPPPAQDASIADLIAKEDISGIKGIKDFSPATPDQRVRMIEILLGQAWVGPYDEWAIEAIWECWGTDGIAGAYADHQALWDQSVEAGAELPGLKVLKPIRAAFEQDVKTLANVYMRQNEAAVLKEAARLNLGNLNDNLEIGGAHPTPDRNKVIELQQQAADLQRADDALAGLLDIPVGMTNEPADSGGGVATAVAKFTPGTPPPKPPPEGQEANFRRYEEVQEQFRSTTAARSRLVASNPTLYVLGGAGDGEAGRVAKLTPEQAAARLRDMLGETLQHIQDTPGKLAADTLDWRDLTPIHKQLWDGLPAASGFAWSEKLNKAVAEDVIGSHKAEEFWINLGLGSLAAAAFIFSEIATSGMATFLWASAGTTVGAVQAGRSWENYDTLAGAAATATSDDKRLVTGEQVGEAKLAAVLDTVFAFIDVFQAAKGVVTAVRATAARKALAGLATMTDDAAAATVVQDAVKSLGAAETIRRAPGKSIDELVVLAGGEKSEAGAALRKASADEIALAGPGSAEARIRAADMRTPATAEGRMMAAQAMPVFERWATLTPVQRLEALLESVNKRLAELGCPPLTAVVDGTDAALQYRVWSMRVSPTQMAASAVTREEFAEAVNTVAHEGEHAAQWFRMVQLEAATTRDVGALATKLQVPDSIAKAAIGVENGTVKGIKLAGSAAESEARLFFESVYGGGSAARNATLKELDNAGTAVREALARQTTLDKLPDGSPLRTSGQTFLDNARKRYDTVYATYRKLPEEIVAHNVGNEAGAAMMERFRLLNELHQTEIVMEDARSVVDFSMDQVHALAEGPAKELDRYQAKVAVAQALDRFKQAVAEVRQASTRLDAAAQGSAP
jgi:hypothetical protein